MPYEKFEGDLIRPIEKSVKDGDTLLMKSEIRLTGIDTPETRFSRGENTSHYDSLLSLSNPKIKSFLRRISPGLRDYLKPKLENSEESVGLGTNQYECGKKGTKEFNSIVKTVMPGNASNLLIMTSLEVTDRYGRLIGYVNRKKRPKKGEVLVEKPTFESSFNVKVLNSGYAFMYLIYPNLLIEKGKTDHVSTAEILSSAADTGTPDIERPMIKTLRKTFKKAVSSGRGLFASRDAFKSEVKLDPFEFRYLARIFDKEDSNTKGPDRLCADMESRKLYPSDRYFEVRKENRLFFDEGDTKIAKKKYDPV
jgi:endonuclease YncB( thermonuclease family)